MTTTLVIQDLITPATGEEWKQRLLDNAATLELPVTAWGPGQPSRTIIAVMSNMFGQEDGIISIIAQGGFLDFAATGSVTYTGVNGKAVTQKVTPDPSIPGENPNGTLGWLDLLASSVYDTDRIGAQFASNILAIANNTSNTYGPFTPGTYHATNPDSGAGYSNAETLTINPASIVGTGINSASNTTPIVIGTSSAHGLTGSEIVFISGVGGNTNANGFWNITVLSTTTFSLNGSTGNATYTSGGTVNVCTTGLFQADVAGPEATSAPGTITQPVTTLSGVQIDNLQAFIGSTWESNIALAARCRLKLQSISDGGPKGGYAYFALTANELLAEESPPVLLSTPITRVKVQTSPTTGVITLTIANAAGAVSGVSNLAVIDATNTSPIEVQTTSNHGLSTGDYVTIDGVIGNTNANGTFTIVVTAADKFTLDSSTGNAAYGSGGVVEGGDVGQVDKIVEANATPSNDTVITNSASAFAVAIVAGVEVPSANVSIYAASVQTALALYFAALPIGGINSKVQYNDIIGVLYAAGQINGQPSYVRRITSLTLNGVAADLTYSGPTYVAQLTPSPAITVTGV